MRRLAVCGAFEGGFDGAPGAMPRLFAGFDEAAGDVPRSGRASGALLRWWARLIGDESMATVQLRAKVPTSASRLGYYGGWAIAVLNSFGVVGALRALGWAMNVAL